VGKFWRSTCGWCVTGEGRLLVLAQGRAASTAIALSVCPAVHPGDRPPNSICISHMPKRCACAKIWTTKAFVKGSPRRRRARVPSKRVGVRRSCLAPCWPCQFHCERPRLRQRPLCEEAQ
jgi:hypothetical protein